MSWLLVVVAVAAGTAAVFSLLGFFRRPFASMLETDLQSRLGQFEQGLRDIPNAVRAEGRLCREDVRGSLTASQQNLETRLGSFSRTQCDQLAAIRQESSDGRAKLEGALKASSDAFSNTQTTRLSETNQAMKDLAERLEKGQSAAQVLQKQALDEVAAKIQRLTEANDKKQDAIRETLTASLDQLRKENEAKLEQMRATVDEKLQGTLDARLGESFKIVSERLELVHKGLGEMQVLATGVGDLKRVLTNVKSRGGWGELQLGTLLQDLLTADQFEKNVRVRPDSCEVVEFAVRLPGREVDQPIFLAIDAKFPQEDYDRLVTAQESGSPTDIDKAGQALERAVRSQAKTVAEKYIHPPHTTDFAIMYLPTEGLFAEVIRRPGLCSALQTQFRVMVTGPTTLTALLNSLQMGFRTLAIERRSSEVWQVLGAAKAEFQRYGEVWEKLGKQLQTAQNTVVEAGRRTRAVTRQLKEVATLEAPVVGTSLLTLPDLEPEADAA